MHSMTCRDKSSKPLCPKHFASTAFAWRSADGGIDMVLHREREKFFVQCKQWKAYQVGVSVVRELYGVMAAEGAAGGFVVTSGKFTPSAIDFAAGRNVVLIDGAILFDMIRNARGSQGSRGSNGRPLSHAKPERDK